MRGGRVPGNSDAVEEAARQEAEKLRIGRGNLAALEAMHPDAKKKANEYARDIADPFSIEANLFQKGFMKRVAEEAKEPGKYLPGRKANGVVVDALLPNGSINPQYQGLMQDMFDKEILENAQKAHEEAEVKAREEAENKLTLEEKKAKDEAAAKAKKEQDLQENLIKKEKSDNYQGALAATNATFALEKIAVAPVDLLTGFIKFLDENSPHKGDFLILIKLCEGLRELIKLPFELGVMGLTAVAMKNGNDKQKEDYNTFINLMRTKPDDVDKHWEKMSATNQELVDSIRKNAENERGGDLNNGVFGGPGI